MLAERLESRPGLLLVIDNLEHLPGAGGILARILDAAPTLRMLATSRRRLAIGAEWVLALDGLPTPETDAAAYSDAVELFVRRAEAAGVPIAEPRLHLVEGRRAQLDGAFGAARRAYDRSARTAQRLGMPWEVQEAARRRDTIECSR